VSSAKYCPLVDLAAEGDGVASAVGDGEVAALLVIEELALTEGAAPSGEPGEDPLIRAMTIPKIPATIPPMMAAAICGLRNVRDSQFPLLRETSDVFKSFAIANSPVTYKHR
jgi:hypothetical protein